MRKKLIVSYCLIISFFVFSVQALTVNLEVLASTVNSSVSTLRPYTYVDSLRDGTIINNTDIDINGWSLNPSGVKELKVFIDDNYLGNATIGLSREDVDKAFPGYVNGANSGYKYTISKNLVAAGSHKVKLVSIGNDDSRYEVTIGFSIKKPAPYTFVDTLKDGAIIDNNNVTLTGWSLNPSGVKELKVHVDNNYLGSATLGLTREDVGKAFPQYFNASKSGFTYTIDKNLIPAGNHEVKLIAIGNDGSEYISQVKFTIKKPAPYTFVDTLKDGAIIDNNNITLTGWSLNPSGVKELKVEVDNKYLGNATIGLSREDVGKAFPQYSNASKSGFTYTIDKNLIPAGNREVKLIAIGNDGSEYIYQVKFTIKKPAPYTFVDTLKDGAIIDNNNITLTGWSLNPSGVKELKVQVDNKYLGNATIGLSREDVGRSFPQYSNADKSGFTYTIDKNLIPAGTREVKLIAVGNDGSEYTSQTKFTLKKPAPYTFVDTLKDGMVIDDENIQLEGWSLNPSGVKEMKVYVDNKVLGSATIGLSRPDIDKVFPGYINGVNSGFKYTIDKNLIPAGSHEVKIQAIGNDGSEYVSTTIFTLKKLEPYTHIDTLNEWKVIRRDLGNIEDEKINLSGWSLNPSGVKEIKVLIDNNFIGNATIGLNRPDVAAAFPKYIGGANSGYNMSISTKSLKLGRHNLVIEAYGLDGSVFRTSVIFSINNGAEVTLNYRAHIANLGWSAYADSGVEVGATDNSRYYLDTMELMLNNTTESMKIKYQVSINGIGWQSTWAENGQVVGTPGSGSAIEAIRIKLEGVPSGYHVIYRTYVRGQGWQGWVADGVMSGVVGKGDVIEAIDVKLVQTDNIKQYVKPKIAVDLGHNINGDNGAVGIRVEADVIRDVGNRVINKLKAHGYTIIETLPKTAVDITDSLNKRSYVANANEADFFVSIHFNKFNGVANGTEVFYYKDSSVDKSYASNIANSISRLGFKNRGIKYGDFSVIRKTTMPSVLVECCFVDSKIDMEIYDPERMANAIVSGILASQ
ncbi:N-acetylmuramoyl-L-alanine amidase [Clostridium sp. UBA4548]|uniref:N-acetylmuramoyl-L-alanine amidase n=1 Tax=Clostridium sp. UBA4548 TaxID=1946361 RepID=UPI0025BC8DBB|nr:N-acetylmuramoyl-L-alanine amidase [Clostridium sp. UBA4548]